jgi:heme/copper-type cytochrome/quinol oxidase subunit 2
MSAKNANHLWGRKLASPGRRRHRSQAFKKEQASKIVTIKLIVIIIVIIITIIVIIITIIVIIIIIVKI